MESENSFDAFEPTCAAVSTWAPALLPLLLSHVVKAQQHAWVYHDTPLIDSGSTKNNQSLAC